MSYDEYEIDEYERDHAHPCKCRETCSKCRFSSCLDNDEECDFCSNFDRRFALEDEGIVNPIHPFRWAMLDGDVQLRF